MIKTTTTLLALAASAMIAAAADPAPAFSVPNTKGETVSLADFKGKVVVLEWTNFECPFVKKHYASGNLPKLQEKYTAKGVVWLTVNSSAKDKQGYLEPAKMAERATKEGNRATHFLIDSEGTMGKAYKAKVTPHMFVIAADGTLAYDGAMDSKATTKTEDIATADPLLANAIDAVLAGKPVANAKNAPYGCGVKYAD
jgi:glutathione peroxidase-family protein